MTRPEQVTLFAAPDADRAGALLEAATVFAASLHEHLVASLRVGRLEAVLGAARGLDALVALVGPALASEAFKTAHRRDAEPER